MDAPTPGLTRRALSPLVAVVAPEVEMAAQVAAAAAATSVVSSRAEATEVGVGDPTSAAAKIRYRPERSSGVRTFG